MIDVRVPGQLGIWFLTVGVSTVAAKSRSRLFLPVNYGMLHWYSKLLLDGALYFFIDLDNNFVSLCSLFMDNDNDGLKVSMVQAS